MFNQYKMGGKTSCGSTWREIKGATARLSHRHFTRMIDANGKNVNDPEAMANVFAEFHNDPYKQDREDPKDVFRPRYERKARRKVPKFKPKEIERAIKQLNK